MAGSQSAPLREDLITCKRTIEASSKCTRPSSSHQSCHRRRRVNPSPVGISPEAPMRSNLYELLPRLILPHQSFVNAEHPLSVLKRRFLPGTRPKYSDSANRPEPSTARGY